MNIPYVEMMCNKLNQVIILLRCYEVSQEIYSPLKTNHSPTHFKQTNNNIQKGTKIGNQHQKLQISSIIFPQFYFLCKIQSATFST